MILWQEDLSKVGSWKRFLAKPAKSQEIRLALKETSLKNFWRSLHLRVVHGEGVVIVPAALDG